MDRVLAQARSVFVAKGYQGSSIDDLVQATGLLRGSLYAAFGSKYGLFKETLETNLNRADPQAETVDLMLVALMEVSADDPHIRYLLTKQLNTMTAPSGQGGSSREQSQKTTTEVLLGHRLLERAGIDLSEGYPKQTIKKGTGNE